MNEKYQDSKNIFASLIIEVIGKPAEHLIEVLEDIIKKINEEKGIKINSKKIHEAKPIEEMKGFFSSFAEIEIEAEEMMHLVRIVFIYMPSHVEIIYPELIALTNNTWSTILTELIRKIHKYDETARILKGQNMIMEKKLKELLPKEKKKEE